MELKVLRETRGQNAPDTVRVQLERAAIRGIHVGQGRDQVTVAQTIPT